MSEMRHCEGGKIGFIVKLTKPVTKLTKSQRCDVVFNVKRPEEIPHNPPTRVCVYRDIGLEHDNNNNKNKNNYSLYVKIF